ncbi:ADP-ribosyl cyclase/cyclic ADP-ribose hydrolase 1 [Callithrix jacchus]|uniref:ADP-ribosyl cyclase/cyclic ADP-ribose hydrolase 1 n=1 Tax=Callithrix jacchus TaxID=9483 RepID=U3CHI9_CALJA|nr:ADP-ribosyl cyclase/cyclic ADP-ribose hydrolase 1 [Callithrix jacchus]
MANCEFRPVSGDKPCCRLSRKAQLCLGVGLLFLTLVVVVAVVVSRWHQQSQRSQWGGRGTTDRFPEIILERCVEYTQTLLPEMRHVDCQNIWDAFKGAFISKHPCKITEEDYQPLLKLGNQTVPCNKTLLWSRTKHLAHQYTEIQRDVFTLEDTLLGYLADDLTWCGEFETSEINYRSCPDWRKDCSSNPVSVFWKTVSRRFAESACGVVHVMLNGSCSNIFDKKSTFGSVEVHNLQPEKVHTLEAWVMHDGRGDSRDLCQDPSIKELELIISKRNITFSCKNIYRPDKFLQCAKTPEDSSCISKI